LPKRWFDTFRFVEDDEKTARAMLSVEPGSVSGGITMCKMIGSGFKPRDFRAGEVIGKARFDAKGTNLFPEDVFDLSVSRSGCKA
jgi:hypothetical protein